MEEPRREFSGSIWGNHPRKRVEEAIEEEVAETGAENRVAKLEQYRRDHGITSTSEDSQW